jgi:hypothetical protein
MEVAFVEFVWSWEKRREAGDGNRGLVYIARVLIAADFDNYGYYHGRFQRDQGVTLQLV